MARNEWPGLDREGMTRLFLYHDFRPVEKQPQVGDVICAWPRHITLGIIATHYPMTAYQTISRVASEHHPITVSSGEMFISGTKRNKPLLRIDDPSGDLHRLHTDLIDSLYEETDAVVHMHWNAGAAYDPHVSLHMQYESGMPLIPKTFDITHVTVAQNHMSHERHHNGTIRLIAELGSHATDMHTNPMQG